MTWSAAGTWHGAHNDSLPLSNQAAGNLLIVEVINYSNSTVWATGMSGGGATWVQAGVKFSGTTNAYSAAVFFGTVTSTGAQTATVSWSGTAPAWYGIAAQEFHSTVGSWSLDKQGNLDSAGTGSWVSLTPAGGAGELYFGFAADATNAVQGTTPGYIWNANVDTAANGAAYNVNCPAGATFPVWNDGQQLFGIMILVAEGGGGPVSVNAPAAEGAGAAPAPAPAALVSATGGQAGGAGAAPAPSGFGATPLAYAGAAADLG